MRIAIFVFLLAQGMLRSLEIPADFQLKYTHDAGMSPIRENLHLFPQKGVYTAYIRGKKVRFKFSREHAAQIQSLIRTLSNSGVFDLKLAPAEHSKPGPPIADKQVQRLFIRANQKSIFLDRSTLGKLAPQNRAAAIAAFEAIAEFTKKYQ